jgi:hypothetical protein
MVSKAGFSLFAVVGVITIAVRLKNKYLKYPSPSGVRSFARLRMTPNICHSGGNYLAVCGE